MLPPFILLEMAGCFWRACNLLHSPRHWRGDYRWCCGWCESEEPWTSASGKTGIKMVYSTIISNPKSWFISYRRSIFKNYINLWIVMDHAPDELQCHWPLGLSHIGFQNPQFCWVVQSSSVKFLSCLKLLQAARAFQQKLESEVSTFLSMAKNEENYGKCFRHIQLLLCRDILGEYF